MKGRVKWVKTKNGVVIAESEWCNNVIVTGSNLGIQIMLDRLANITTHDGIVTYADIGDDDTAATSADTALGNGLVRAQVSAYKTPSALVREFRFFYPDATTPDDTYKEFGMFIGGTAAVGSGQLFNHLVMSDLVKATGEDHTIVCQVTGSV
jgi:hypothetical protein